MPRIYDLSVPTEDSPSEPLPLKVVHSHHDANIPVFDMLFGAKKDEIPDKTGWAVDDLSLSTHAGTHVDAPWHYSPQSEGKKARTIDQIPLEWFFHDGVILDMRDKPRGYGITIEDLKAALMKIKFTLKPWDIVLIQTGTDKLWGEASYFSAGSGMTEESTLWLMIRVAALWGQMPGVGTGLLTFSKRNLLKPIIKAWSGGHIRPVSKRNTAI
jgi:kynurenine formamidase